MEQEQENLNFMAPTIASSGKRVWLYPDRRRGLHASRRRVIASILIVIYLVLPWINLSSGPFLRFDFINGRIYFLGQVLQLSEASYLAFPLVGMALLLFFLTAWRGRLWCGYACPQTVFVEWVIRPIEELCEGSAHHRQMQDQKPLTFKVFLRKLVKHVLFIIVAIVVANGFLAYFIDPATLFRWIISPPLEHPYAFAIMMFVLVAFYLDLSWFREQFCAFLCPYARFQSVMIDRHTPVVTYDSKRGEPRGRRSSGHCIDCGLCQRVCPTGIDIRNGLQLECINCNRCADACNMVMTNLKRPNGLIRTMSQNEFDGHTPRSFFSRPRLLVYGLLMVIAFSLPVIYLRLVRSDITLKISRQPGVAFSTLPDGRYANAFNMRSVNHTSQDVALKLQTDVPGIEVICGSCKESLPAFTVKNHVLLIVVPKDKSSLERVKVTVEGHDDTEVDVPLILPKNR